MTKEDKEKNREMLSVLLLVTVIAITDGDTLIVPHSEQQTKVRFAKISTHPSANNPMPSTLGNHFLHAL